MGHCRLLWDLFQLKRNEHKTRKQIQTLQEKRLHKLLRYAFDILIITEEVLNRLELPGRRSGKFLCLLFQQWIKLYSWNILMRL